MAGSIKGIVVEIGGDTSGLQNALKKVNSVTSSLSKELRGVNSLLKLDPKNPELLAQKQKILNDEIEVTSTKLEELKNHQKEIEESGQTLTAEQKKNYRALQREIVATEQKLKELNAENSKWLKNGKKIEEIGKKFTNVGNKISNLGDKLTKIGTTAGLAIGGVAVKSAIEFESAFTGVKKTVDGTDEQLEKLKQGIKDLATKIPSTTTEISAVAEAAGQLGIATDDVLNFTKVMIDLGNSTNLSADEASSALAKFANITKMSAKDYQKLGSTIVDLGNNFATTEADIVAMATRLAATGDLAGLSQAEILSLATAMNSVGIEAEAGGSAMSKLLKKIQIATETGGKDLKQFAKVSGMTTAEFKKYFKEDAVGALSAFIGGLNDTKRNGKSAISVLDDMGLTEVRLSNTILSLANSGDLMTRAVKLGNKAWKENSALSKEASQRYKTLKSRLETTRNKVTNMATSLGDKLTPTINKMLDKVDKFIDKMSNLSEEESKNALKMGLIVVAAGPVLKILGKLTSGVGATIKTIGLFSQAIGVMKTGVASTNATVTGLAKVLGGLTSPVGIATLAITGTITAIALMTKSARDAQKQTQEAFKTMGTAASDYIKGIQEATSHLGEFNRTLFASNEEQQKLEEEMNKVQQGITKICKTASDERRDYTQKEIKQLDEYFKKLRELNQRELEIEQSIAKAISQQAVTNAETFKGTLEEYKTQSQEWIKTAEEQKTKEIELINTQTTEEIALLNQRFGKKATMENEAYQKEYNKIISNKEANVKQVEEEIATITQKYAEGYLERVKQEDGFYTKIEEVHQKQQEETQRYNDKILEIEKMTWLDESTIKEKKELAEKLHNSTMKSLWKSAYTNMSDSQKEQLGAWLAMLSDTEVQGGKLDKKTQDVVDEILNSFEEMPKDSKKIMGETMQGMMNGMQEKEPSLFKKATGIADGILSRLRKTFDINSPSKETRDIFRYVMKGAELGLEDERKSLNSEIDKISKEALDNFNMSSFGFNNGLKNSIIDSTRTIFTTPQIVFNVQELDEAKLQQCFNYVNRKFGSAY